MPSVTRLFDGAVFGSLARSPVSCGPNGARSRRSVGVSPDDGFSSTLSSAWTVSRSLLPPGRRTTRAQFALTFRDLAARFLGVGVPTIRNSAWFARNRGQKRPPAPQTDDQPGPQLIQVLDEAQVILVADRPDSAKHAATA